MQLRIDQPTSDRIDQQVSYTIDYAPPPTTRPLFGRLGGGKVLKAAAGGRKIGKVS